MLRPVPSPSPTHAPNVDQVEQTVEAAYIEGPSLLGRFRVAAVGLMAVACMTFGFAVGRQHGMVDAAAKVNAAQEFEAMRRAADFYNYFEVEHSLEEAALVTKAVSTLRPS